MAGDHEGYAKSQGDDCRCETLPTGEKICDPYGCKLKEILIQVPMY